MGELTGKLAVATGASKGIGAAIAKYLAAERAAVVANYSSDKKGAERLSQFRQVSPSKLRSSPCSSRQRRPMAKSIDVTPEHFDKTFNINARGVFFTVQKALPHLNDGASIVITGSGVWVKEFPAYGTYAATKAALRSFVRTWTTELKDRKIRVNIISPCAVEIPIIDGQFATKEAADGARQYFSSITPLGRLGLPQEIAAAALFLASDESSNIAGIDLPIYGGITAV